MMSARWFVNNYRKVVSQKNPMRFLIGHSIKKVVRIISTLYPRFLDIVPIVYQKGDFKLRLAPTLLSYVMYEYNDVRADDESFIKKILGEGEIYVDVGANVGNTTLAAATAVGNTGHVYAYEAHPRTYRYLLGSIACNKNLAKRITPINIALGEERGEVLFSDLQNDDINRVNTAGKIKVHMESLDAQNLPDRIHVIKIDVEGYELSVLKGAKNVLARTDIIIFESFIQNYKEFNVNLHDIIAYLKGFGFSIYRSEGGMLIPIKDTHISYECEDLIACKDVNLLLRKGLKLASTSQ